MDRPNDISATSLLQALLLPGFYEVLNRADDADFDDYHALRDQLEEQQGDFIAEAAPAIEAALNRYIDRQLAAPMVPAVRGVDYDPRMLAAIFLDPSTPERELESASLYGYRAGDDAEPDIIGDARNLLAEYCHLLGDGDRAEALALLAVLVGDFDAWRQALAGEDLDTLQRDLKAEAEGVRVRGTVIVRVPEGRWNDYTQEATLDVEVSTVVAEGETVAEAIRSCQLGAPLLDFESPELWGGPVPVRQVAKPERPRSFAPFGDPFADPRIDYADELADPLASGFSIANAIRAHEGTSHVPERRGIASIANNVRFLRKVRDYFMRYAETEKQQEVAAEEFERYRQGYISHTNREQARRAQVRSAMIDGPANFGGRRNQARSSAYEKAVEGSAAWSERAQKAAIRAIKEAGPYGDTSAPISSDDPDALGKIERKIAELKEYHAATLKANKLLLRELSDEETAAGLRALGFDEGLVKFHTFTRYHPRKGQEKGGRWLFVTTNVPANIRRLQKRAEQLARSRGQSSAAVMVGDVKVRDSVEDNRLMLYFPGKPDATVREKLKSHGFRWAPSEGAWQAYRGGNALYWAGQILGVPDLQALLDASTQPEPEVEEEVEVIPVPVEEVEPEELEAIAEPEPEPTSVTAYEFSQMQSDEDKRAGAADLMRQLSPRRQPVPEPEPAPAFPFRSAAEWLNSLESQGVINAQGKVNLAATEPEPAPRKLSIEEDRKRAKMLVKVFPPIEVVFESVPPALALDGSVIRPGFSGWKLAGTTGSTLAATREEVEQRAADRRETEMTEENRRLLALSRDGFNSERERLLGFGEVVSDYLDTATFPANREKLLAELSKPEMQKEGRKKTDKTFQGTRAEVVDQMLKAGYFPIVQRPPGGSKEVPLLKNWQGVFEVKPEVYAFAEWLQARRKRDERALELDGARESARWEAQQARQSNPRRRSNPDAGLQHYTLAEHGIEGFGVPPSLLPATTLNPNVPTARYEYVYGNRPQGMGWGVYQRSIKSRDAGDTGAWKDQYGTGHLSMRDHDQVARWGDALRMAEAKAAAESAASYPWIVSVFGKETVTPRVSHHAVSDFFTPLNSKDLSDYLEGSTEVFAGAPDRRWLSGLQALGAIDDAGKIDIAKVRAAYRASIGRTGNPRRRSNPDIGTSMIYGYGINQMTPSAPMGGRTANGAAASVRQARLAAEAERLAQRLARGRR
jgi:hypothetical protein